MEILNHNANGRSLELAGDLENCLVNVEIDVPIIRLCIARIVIGSLD